MMREGGGIGAAQFILPGLRRGVFCVVLIGIVGALANPWVQPAWDRVRAAQPVLRQDSLADAAGQGVLLGVFGGFRSLLADMAWIRTSFFWSDRDVDRTRAAVILTTQIDPRPFYFWMQGARILAYDVPRWRVQVMEEQGSLFPGNDARQIREEQAFEAIGLLYRSADFHPREPRVWIEIAQIYQNVLSDSMTAGEYFGKAARMEGAPYFAGRLHAELLRRGGKPGEAYRFYREWYPTLPDSDPFAVKGLVRQRIRELEEELGVPPSKRMRF